MRTFTNVHSTSCVAQEEIKAYDLVGFDDKPAAADDAPVKGVALSPAMPGDAYAAISMGSCQLIAKGAVTAGTKVCSAADGGVKASPSATNPIGRALHDAADGMLVDVLLR